MRSRSLYCAGHKKLECRELSRPKLLQQRTTLPTYDTPAPASFWQHFPFRAVPTTVSSPVQSARLAQLLRDYAPRLSLPQRLRGWAAIRDIERGACAFQRAPLPSAVIANSGSVFAHGAQFSDSLCALHRAGFLAGPFAAPPLAGFRANSMLAAHRKGKVRVIMNLSAPEGACLNDNMEEAALEKVVMVTAREVGYRIVACGAGARLWKFDFVDAYKNIPNRLADLPLMGLCWLGMFFIELQLAFGAKHAVAAFDRLGNTVAVLAILISCILPYLVMRAVDDLTVVTPAASAAGPRFERVYKWLCGHLNLALAPPCPNFDKAFCDSTVGTVLGVRFNTQSLSWSLLPLKQNRLLVTCGAALQGAPLSLKATQELLGSLNDFGQMCPFLRAFRQPLYQFLSSFQGAEHVEPQHCLLHVRRRRRLC